MSDVVILEHVLSAGTSRGAIFDAMQIGSAKVWKSRSDSPLVCDQHVGAEESLRYTCDNFLRSEVIECGRQEIAACGATETTESGRSAHNSYR